MICTACCIIALVLAGYNIMHLEVFFDFMMIFLLFFKHFLVIWFGKIRP